VRAGTIDGIGRHDGERRCVPVSIPADLGEGDDLQIGSGLS